MAEYKKHKLSLQEINGRSWSSQEIFFDISKYNTSDDDQLSELQKQKNKLKDRKPEVELLHHGLASELVSCKNCLEKFIEQTQDDNIEKEYNQFTVDRQRLSFLINEFVG